MHQRHTDYVPPPCLQQHETLFEDEHIVVVVKPDGLLSVPGRIVKDSLISRLKDKHPTVAPAHRLDLDTSGIMVVPISKTAMREISAQFRERLVHKEYIADVIGVLNEKNGSIDLPIGPDWDNRPRNQIDHENGKQALTHYQQTAINANKTASRLLLTPITGRSHQLRLHLKALDHEILGCDLYAREPVYTSVPRLHLHASMLEFAHPVSQEKMRFESPAPFELPNELDPELCSTSS